MRTHRALVGASTLLLATGLVVCAGALVWWYHSSQIDFETADRDQLFRWLVTHDLDGQPPEAREKLAIRLDSEISCEVDWEEINQQLKPEHHRRLWDNLPFLLKPWFLDKVEQYHACARSDRREFLDNLIDMMAAFRGLDRLAPRENPEEAARGLKGLLFVKVKEWREEVTPDERARIDEFVAAVQARWFYRKSAEVLKGIQSFWSKPEAK
jgi:hypothetical protein